MKYNVWSENSACGRVMAWRFKNTIISVHESDGLKEKLPSES